MKKAEYIAKHGEDAWELARNRDRARERYKLNREKMQAAEYRGLALVDAKPHRYGIIDVILILDGKITLLTKEDVTQQQERVV